MRRVRRNPSTDQALVLGGRAAMIVFGAYLAWPGGAEDVAVTAAGTAAGGPVGGGVAGLAAVGSSFAIGMSMVLSAFLLPNEDLRKFARALPGIN